MFGAPFDLAAGDVDVGERCKSARRTAGDGGGIERKLLHMLDCLMWRWGVRLQCGGRWFGEVALGARLHIPTNIFHVGTDMCFMQIPQHGRCNIEISTKRQNVRMSIRQPSLKTAT